MTTTLTPNQTLRPVADPRGFVRHDLAKGGVQGDLSDLRPNEWIPIDNRAVDPRKIPRGLHNHPEGVVVPDWLDVRAMHRFPQPEYERYTMPPGRIDHEKFAAKAIKDGQPFSYADNPRPVICGNGDYLVTVLGGDDHYALKPIGWKLNEIYLHRSRDKGLTWDPPVLVPHRYSQHGWPILRATRSGNGNRLATMFTMPTPGAFDGAENGGLGWRVSDDHGHTWSEPRRVSPINDPNFIGMFCLQPTETASGAWLFAPHEGHFEAYWPDVPVIHGALFLMRSEDQGETWEQYPAPWPKGWSLKPNDRLDEGRVICLADGTLLIFSRGQQGHLWLQRGSDDGRAWTDPRPTKLVHPDAPPMVSTLSDGQTLIALTHHNKPADGGFCAGSRHELWVQLSRDAGETWTEPRFLMTSSTHTTRGMWHVNLSLCSYADTLADRGMLHIFVPHNWRQVLQVRLPESEIDRLPTAREIGA